MNINNSTKNMSDTFCNNFEKKNKTAILFIFDTKIDDIFIAAQFSVEW